MAKYTSTMALATINECHARECSKGYWIAAGILGELHQEHLATMDNPPAVIPTVTDIYETVARYIDMMPAQGLTSSEVELWVNEETNDWGIQKAFPYAQPPGVAYVRWHIYPDSDPYAICFLLLADLAAEVGITPVCYSHPLLRALRAERDPNAVASMRAANSSY